MKFHVTGQDAEKASVQYILDGKQSMTVFKDVRTLVNDAMNAAVLALDPDGRTVPYMLSGGTDAKAFARLGIRCFGFSPLRLPPELDFAALFHGVDERVPVDSLRFGTEVLARFLTHC